MTMSSKWLAHTSTTSPARLNLISNSTRRATLSPRFVSDPKIAKPRGVGRRTMSATTMSEVGTRAATTRAFVRSRVDADTDGHAAPKTSRKPAVNPTPSTRPRPSRARNWRTMFICSIPVGSMRGGCAEQRQLVAVVDGHARSVPAAVDDERPRCAGRDVDFHAQPALVDEGIAGEEVDVHVEVPHRDRAVVGRGAQEPQGPVEALVAHARDFDVAHRRLERAAQFRQLRGHPGLERRLRSE